MDELIKRLGALAFSAFYLSKHGSERASALRVAHLAYRFLDGDDVDIINREADEANAVREAGTKPKKQTPRKKLRPKFPVKVHIKSIRRLIKHGR